MEEKNNNKNSTEKLYLFIYGLSVLLRDVQRTYGLVIQKCNNMYAIHALSTLVYSHL